jgi:hypothetical protein
MQADKTPKKYCVNTNSHKNNYSASSLLCDKCNQNQEIKLTKLKDFEEKMDVIIVFFLLLLDSLTAFTV